VLALLDGRVLAAPDAPALDGASVVIENGRIVNVGTRGRVTVPAGARVIDCRGMTIVAAFQNSHVHFTEGKWDAARTIYEST
jgi:cytosine/adenosine deaminase-related metal-dependent hydrolase